MAKMDDFLQNLQKMDPKQLRILVASATKNLSPAQQQKLKSMLEDPGALEKLKSKVSDQDLEKLSSNIRDPKSLDQFMKQSDVQKRIDELF